MKVLFFRIFPKQSGLFQKGANIFSLQNLQIEACNLGDSTSSPIENYTFLQILELLDVPSIQKRTRVSWLFIRHIKEKGGGRVV